MGQWRKIQHVKIKWPQKIATALKGFLAPVIYSSVLGFVAMLGEAGSWNGRDSPHTTPQQKDKGGGAAGEGISAQKDTNEETCLKLPWPLEEKQSLPNKYPNFLISMQVWSLNSHYLYAPKSTEINYQEISSDQPNVESTLGRWQKQM